MANRPPVKFRYRGHVGWNTWKIILWLISLGCSLYADPNIMDLLQGIISKFQVQYCEVLPVYIEPLLEWPQHWWSRVETLRKGTRVPCGIVLSVIYSFTFTSAFMQ